MQKTNSKSRVAVSDSTIAPLFGVSRATVADSRFWRWGSDNLLPDALALVARNSTVHRRIINDKADYISGKGVTWDENLPQLGVLVTHINGSGESLRQLLNKVAFDKTLFGNAFIEVVTDTSGSFLSLYHLDASKVRLARDSQHILLHHSWNSFTPSEAVSLPLYPLFEPRQDGTQRSVIRYAGYEPMFSHYGVPDYIAGLNASAIVYKTDRWNICRLDNSFQLSGVMLLDGVVDGEQQAADITRLAERKFGGTPGQVMFIMRDSSEGDNSRFIPLNNSSEGDWRELHDQATADIVVAHSWFRALSGLDFSAGFSSERIIQEYELALNTIILSEQADIMEPIRAVIERVMGVCAQSLTIVNHPPTQSRPAYMKVWEARRAEGLDYDESDPTQNIYLAQLSNLSLQ
ncbi:MAG: phage portal protein [Rikenellaceae bacterium]|nr:phage portal protein [Rikenellaceae bacterium]